MADCILSMPEVLSILVNEKYGLNYAEYWQGRLEKDLSDNLDLALNWNSFLSLYPEMFKEVNNG